MHRAGGGGAPLIFEDHSGAAAPDAVLSLDRTGYDLLQACAIEAARHADAVTRMDRVLGDALECGEAKGNSQTLQRLDLLRQEAEGIARLLNFVADLPALDAIIDRDAFSKCVPLAAQRARLLS